MRCPDCNKFVAYGEASADVESAQVEGGEVRAEVRAVLPCEQCGVELKETIFEIELVIDHTCTVERENAEDPIEFELDDYNAEPWEDSITKTVTRGRRTGQVDSTPTYGAEFTCIVSCPHCKAVIELSDRQAIPSSQFEGLV
jgi:phage FluMu protein Com